MSRKAKSIKNQSSQDFIPLKDIRNGIIETTDGRYIKILEIEPINFLLRSTLNLTHKKTVAKERKK